MYGIPQISKLLVWSLVPHYIFETNDLQELFSNLESRTSHTLQEYKHQLFKVTLFCHMSIQAGESSSSIISNMKLTPANTLETTFHFAAEGVQVERRAEAVVHTPALAPAMKSQGPVLRVPGYRSRGPGATRFSEK
jgi:hypothetical protein